MYRLFKRTDTCATWDISPPGYRRALSRMYKVMISGEGQSSCEAYTRQVKPKYGTAQLICQVISVNADVDVVVVDMDICAILCTAY